MTLEELIPIKREDSRAAIAGCNDLDVLTALFREADDSVRDLTDDIGAFRHAGTASEDWLRRAGSRLASTTKLRRWIDARIQELGGTAPWPPNDMRNRQIRALEAQVSDLKATLRETGASLPARADAPLQQGKSDG